MKTSDWRALVEKLTREKLELRDALMRCQAECSAIKAQFARQHQHAATCHTLPPDASH